MAVAAHQLVLAVGGFGGRRIGRFIVFHTLFRVLGPVGGTVVIVAIVLALALAPRMLRRRR